jgi:hypothetical protein
MTRAKEMLYLIADLSSKSKFVTELETETGTARQNRCPMCKNAELILRKTGTAKTGKMYKFYGCTNYLYGCNYTFTEW